MTTQILHLFVLLVLCLVICNTENIISCGYKTSNPTPGPTASPTVTIPPHIIDDIKSCPNSHAMDIVILNDISCAMTQHQCELQQNMIAESILSIKHNSTINTIPLSRVAYIEFDVDSINNAVSLINNQYNTNPVTRSDMISFYNKTRNSADCTNSKSRTGAPDLDVALDAAWNQFDMAKSNREKHILIFSNCEAPSYILNEVCENAETYRIDNNVNIIMVNNGANFANADSYLTCLVENDENKIFTNVDFSHVKWDDNIRANIQDLICDNSTITSISPTTERPTQAPITPTTHTPTTPTTHTPTIHAPTTQAPTTHTPTTDTPTQTSMAPTSTQYTCYTKNDNPCSTLTPDDINNNRMYYPSCTDACHFIQCNKQGIAFDMPTAPGTKWDQNVQPVGGQIACYNNDCSNICPTNTYQNMRRLLHKSRKHQSQEDKSPCIRMKITLETENLLPINIQPDPSSNIAVIGKALGDATNGTTTVPMTPDLEDGDDINDYPGWEPWVLEQRCQDISDNQVTQRYWRNEPWQQGLELVILETANGFTATADFTTNESIVYIFKLSELPLYIHHECNGFLNISAAIYFNGELVEGAKTYELVEANLFVPKIFQFFEDVSLLPDTTYEIRFELVDKYPSGCDFNQINFGGGTNRRRLLETLYINGQAYASSCQISNALAISPKMKASVSAMCSDSLGFTERDNIQTGLFRQHTAMSSVRDQIFKTGSLHLYNITNGKQIGYSSIFPQNDIKEPCIAIDEKNNILYAIGGYIGKDEAVDTIQAFQLYNTTNGTSNQIGEIISTPNDWKLDKPRYGASCIFYEEIFDNFVASRNLVVIGGMKNKSLEFTDKLKWEKDIRIYPIPKQGDDADDYDGTATSPPFGTYVNMERALSDLTPIIIDGSKLFLFGGKTHKTSTGFVQSIDLNRINADGILTDKMKLCENKALPLTDLIQAKIGDSDCSGYMVFSGQTYADYKLINNSDGLNTNFTTLFCNTNTQTLFDDDSERRRMSEFDNQMLRSVDRENSRRLQIETDERTEVSIVEYNYHLDGLWYEFSVELELCYENNDELMDAVEYYNGVIDLKVDNVEWIKYKKDLSEKILNRSLLEYETWSDGFGAVDVIDLEILDVQEEYTPCSSDKKSKSKDYGKYGTY